MLRTILIIILVLALVGALPTWGTAGVGGTVQAEALGWLSSS
jgi:hypothetical protein